MTFCSNCGESLSEGQKFCSKCGEKVREASVSERKIIFDGEVHKCPHCGEVLKSLDAVCPSCKHEITNKGVSSAVSSLMEKLNKIDAQKYEERKKEDSFLKKTLGFDFRNKEKEAMEEDERRELFESKKDEQKASIIQNFTVPNTKADILEFLIIAQTRKKDKKYPEASKAWKQKYNQLCDKVEIIFKDDHDFDFIRVKKQAEIAEKKKKMKIIFFSIISGIALVSIIVFSIIISSGKKKEERIANGEIKIGISASQLEGEDYMVVMERFENLGFTNIQAEPITDLITGWVTKDGEVEEVIIGGNNTFSSTEYFHKDTKIIIRYHTFK